MWRTELASELTQAGPGNGAPVIARYAKETGHSPQHLYRVAGQHGFHSGKTRSDKGVLTSRLTDQQIEFVAALLSITARDNKGPIMPMEDALSIAVDNGIIEPGQVTPGTMNRILKDRSMSKAHMKAPRPHTEMRSLHPNHCHAFDVSVCIQYYLKNGKLAMMDEKRFYKNKLDNFKKINKRILRYVIVDHFSGAYYFQYYNTTGETQENLYDFLTKAWSAKQDEQFPFRGVPSLMLMDTGAANTSKAIIAMLERLDVKIPKGNPYNPQRQGSVEKAHNIIETKFETRLRIQPATSVDEMNAWALDFMIYHQAAIAHRRHGMPRTQCWLLIKPEQLRELPPAEILQDLYANPEEERTVDGTYSISFRGKPYSLKHVGGLFRGAKVMAILKPFKWPLIDIRYKDVICEAAPVERLSAQQGGFGADAAVIGREYKAPRETVTQQAKKRLDNLAYGDEPKKDAVPFEGLTVFGHQAEKVQNLAFMPREGTPIEVDRTLADSRISFMEFLKRLVQAVGPITKAQNQALRLRLGDSVSTSEVDALIKEFGEEAPRRDAARRAGLQR